MYNLSIRCPAWLPACLCIDYWPQAKPSGILVYLLIAGRPFWSDSEHILCRNDNINMCPGYLHYTTQMQFKINRIAFYKLNWFK